MYHNTVHNFQYVTKVFWLNFFFRQIERLHLENPERRVIFITFESAVEVYGDCTSDTIQEVPSNIHNEFDPLLSYGEKYSREHHIKPLSESYE